MTQDVRQWLAEIRTLQQRLTQIQQERDEAYAGAANWRRLYETEAQQRRTEAYLSRETINNLKAEVAQLQSQSPLDQQRLLQLQQEIDGLEIAELKRRLTTALLECDRLTQALKAEQVEHHKTRKELTTALGDTVDMLTRERAARVSSPNAEPTGSETKSPSLELPTLSQAQSRV